MTLNIFKILLLGAGVISTTVGVSAFIGENKSEPSTWSFLSIFGVVIASGIIFIINYFN